MTDINPDQIDAGKPQPLEWRDGDMPYSTAFGDHFYCREDGRAECGHVFLAGNGLPERWAAGGAFVIVGYHPHFLINGIPTHFDRRDGTPVAIDSRVHLLSDHAKAAHRAGWMLAEMDEGVVDDAWIAKKPKWQSYRSHPVSFAMVWRQRAPIPSALASSWATEGTGLI